MCDDPEKSKEPEEYDGSEKRGRWTNHQKWSFIMTAAGVVVTIAASAAQLYLTR